MKITHKRIFITLALLLILTITNMCTYDIASAKSDPNDLSPNAGGLRPTEPNVCGADDTCTEITIRNFCVDDINRTPEPRDFIVRMFDTNSGHFFDQVVTVEEIIGNTIVYVTTFAGLDETHAYQYRVHYNNYFWTPWTDALRPPSIVQWQIGELCYPYQTFLPLINK